MGWIFAALSGLLLGLATLPTGFWWIGLAFGVPLVLWFYQEIRLSQFFLFAFVKIFFSYIWLLASLVATGQGFLAWSYYLLGSALVAIPLWLGLLLSLFLADLIKADEENRLFYRVILFPLGYYLANAFGFLDPFEAIPGGKLAEQPFLAGMVSDSFSVLGSNGLDALWLAFFLYLPLPFQIKAASRRIFPLPWVVMGCLLMTHLLGGIPESEAEPIEVLAMPWSGSLGENPSQAQALTNLSERLRRANRQETKLILWQEGAIPGQPLQTGILPSLQQEVRPDQALLFGALSHRVEFGERLHQNSLFLLKGGQVLVSSKESLVPFGEYIPGWAKWMGLKPLMEQAVELHEGQSQNFLFEKVPFAAAICFESFEEDFYRDREDQVEFYLIHSREYAFNAMGKEALFNATRAMALQTYKPVLRIVGGGLSGVVAAEWKGQDQGEWIPSVIAGRYQLKPQPRVALYYRFGGMVTPLLLFGVFGLVVSIAYLPFYKKG